MSPTRACAPVGTLQGHEVDLQCEMGQMEVREFCQIDASDEKLLKTAVLKLARTVADLVGSEMIAANHVKAIQYRPRGNVEYCNADASIQSARLPPLSLADVLI